MEREQVIRMAREACGEDQDPFVSGWVTMDHNELARFAALVAAAEREACAKLVDPTEEHRRDASWGYLGGEEGVELLDAKAAAIRARGQA